MSSSAAPFAGNIIPASRFDPSAAKMNADRVFGTANLPGLTNNLYYLYRNIQDAHQADGRIDFNASDKHRLFFRYSLLNSTATQLNRYQPILSGRSSQLSQSESEYADDAAQHIERVTGK